MSFGAFGFQMLEKLGTNASNLFGTGERVKERERKDALHDFREQERTGIMSRVDGAKAAGLHPLAALGYQMGSAPSIPVGTSKSGQQYNVSRDPAVDQEMRQAQLRLLNSQADEASARAAASNRSLATQPGNAQPLMPTDSDNLVPGQGLRSGITVVPSKITAGTGGVQAGTHQGARTVRIPLGDGHTGKLRVPGEELSQGLEDLDAIKTLITLAMNRKQIGNFFTDDVPWAMRGWLDDARKAIKKGNEANPKRARNFSGGATGNY